MKLLTVVVIIFDMEIYELFEIPLHTKTINENNDSSFYSLYPSRIQEISGSKLIVYGRVKLWYFLYKKLLFSNFILTSMYNCQITKFAYAVDVLDSNVLNVAELHIDITARNLDYR